MNEQEQKLNDSENALSAMQVCLISEPLLSARVAFDQDKKKKKTLILILSYVIDFQRVP
jgi:hypothetical protein